MALLGLFLLFNPLVSVVYSFSKPPLLLPTDSASYCVVDMETDQTRALPSSDSRPGRKTGKAFAGVRTETSAENGDQQPEDESRV